MSVIRLAWFKVFASAEWKAGRPPIPAGRKALPAPDEAAISLDRLVMTAAVMLPSMLPPGNEAIALTCLTYVYSPAVLRPILTTASERVQQLGCPASEVPGVDVMSQALLRNRCASKLGLQVEAGSRSKSKLMGRGPSTPPLMEGEGSILPLPSTWIYSEVPCCIPWHLLCLYATRTCCCCAWTAWLLTGQQQSQLPGLSCLKLSTLPWRLWLIWHLWKARGKSGPGQHHSSMQRLRAVPFKTFMIEKQASSQAWIDGLQTYPYLAMQLKHVSCRFRA